MKGLLHLSRRTLVVSALAFATQLTCTSSHGAVLEFNIQAYVDGLDQLTIQGNTLQWHHFTFSAVGRWDGLNEPTRISAWQDGVKEMNDVSWVPDWPEPPPAQIRYEAWSSQFTGLVPTLPSTDMKVTFSWLRGRWSAGLLETQSAANGYRTVIDFYDAPAGADWYEIQVRFEPVPELTESGVVTAFCLLSFSLWRHFRKNHNGQGG